MSVECFMESLLRSKYMSNTRCFAEERERCFFSYLNETFFLFFLKSLQLPQSDTKPAVEHELVNPEPAESSPVIDELAIT